MIPRLTDIPRCAEHRFSLLTSAGLCPTCEWRPWITVGEDEKADAVEQQRQRMHHWAKARGQILQSSKDTKRRAMIASEASRIARAARDAAE